MDDILLVTPQDNLLLRLTSINGNVGLDKLTPSIWVAQVTDIKRILTNDLYNKILVDFDTNNLTDIYLEIFNKYVQRMIVFFTTADFIMKNSIMISNGGNFKHSPANAQVVDYKENDRLAKYYKEMGVSVEMEFIEFMKDKNVPEYKKSCGGNDNSFKFSWVL